MNIKKSGSVMLLKNLIPGSLKDRVLEKKPYLDPAQLSGNWSH